MFQGEKTDSKGISRDIEEARCVISNHFCFIRLRASGRQRITTGGKTLTSLIHLPFFEDPYNPRGIILKKNAKYHHQLVSDIFALYDDTHTTEYLALRIPVKAKMKN